MLSLLRVRHLALIEKLELEFAPGLNVISGEAGAGKSVLLDAIRLLFGGRANPACIRAGAERAEVEATFDVSVWPGIQAYLDDAGLASEAEPGELVIRREVHSKGRSRAWINGRLVPIGQLAELGGRLADWHGQHESLSLLEPARQRDLFDEFSKLMPLRRQMAEAHAAWSALDRRLEELSTDDREASQRLDFVAFQIREIEELSPIPGETDQLAIERARLANTSGLRQTLGALAAILAEGTDERPAVVDLLGEAASHAAGAQRLDPSLEATLAPLADCAATLNQLARDVSRTLDRLADDPERLAEIDDRLNQYRHLERKHGAGADALLAALDTLKTEAEVLANRDTEREAVAARREEAGRHLLGVAQRLTDARIAAAKGFSTKLQQRIRALAMPNARVAVEWGPVSGPPTLAAPDGTPMTISRDGAEAIVLHFGANAGEPMAPLGEVVSGGELSRVMLALHAMAAGADVVPVLVFDEIDTGLSGEAALSVGNALGELAARHQLVCVTHHPTVASRADNHILVRKDTAHGRTTSRATVLDDAGRRTEIARLLDGGTSAKGLELADELLRGALAAAG